MNHTAQIFLTWPSVSSCVRHGCHPLEKIPADLSDPGWAERPYSFCPRRTPALYLLYKRVVWQKFSTPGISELSVQNIWDSGEMLSKDRCKTTSGFFVIPLLSQLWEEKNYCERRNELSSWRPVALPNLHKHLCLFKLGYDVHALLSSVMYILSGENITAVYSTTRRRWDQNTTQVANRLNRARATYVRLLHVPPWEKLLITVISLIPFWLAFSHTSCIMD